MVSNTQQAADRAIQDQDRREADHERHGLAAYDTPAAIEKARRQPDNHDHCEMPAVKLGQGSYERAWPDDGTTSSGERFGCTIEEHGTLFVVRAPTDEYLAMWSEGVATWEQEMFTYDSPARCREVLGMATDPRPSNIRPVSDPEQKQIDETLDAFGIDKPSSSGVPAAPAPLFTTWDGEHIHYGSVICPNTAPDSQWIAGECIDGTLTLQHLHTESRMRLSREACGKCWAIAVHRASAKPEPRAPVDIAQVLLLEIDSIKHEQQRNRVRGLILELLSRCA